MCCWWVVYLTILISINQNLQIEVYLSHVFLPFNQHVFFQQDQTHHHKGGALSRSFPPSKHAPANCPADIHYPLEKMLGLQSVPRGVEGQCLSRNQALLVTATLGDPGQDQPVGLLPVPWRPPAVPPWGPGLPPLPHLHSSQGRSHMVCSR